MVTPLTPLPANQSLFYRNIATFVRFREHGLREMGFARIGSVAHPSSTRRYRLVRATRATRATTDASQCLSAGIPQPVALHLPHSHTHSQ